MLTLCLDTAHKHLVVGLIQDDQIIAQMQQESWKKQSELILPEIDRMLKTHKLLPNHIDQIVITNGPGSFTGVRISMTIAKILGSVAHKTVYTLSTLQLYAADKSAIVLIDARGNRAYYGKYQNYIGKDEIISIDDLKAIVEDDHLIIGDGSLLDREDNYPNIVENFLKCKTYWQKVNSIDLLEPVYLKENSEYQNAL